MKEDDLFREIGMGVVIWLTLAFLPVIFVWELFSSIYQGIKRK